MSPQDLLFNAKNSILGRDLLHKMYLQQSRGCFHHCKHRVFTMVGLWEHDKIHPSGLPVFIFQPSSSGPNRLYLLGLLNCCVCFTFINNLCNNMDKSTYPDPIYRLHLFFDGLRYHGPMELEMIYSYVATPDLSEPLCTWMTAEIFSHISQLTYG